MALFGWIVAVIACLLFTAKGLFWLAWVSYGGCSKGERIFLVALWCVIAFAWYKVVGWFPYELSAKSI